MARVSSCRSGDRADAVFALKAVTLMTPPLRLPAVAQK
jgi:hypothetical protein